MEPVVEFLVNYGYGGMLVAAFLGGSFVPFTSEAVLTALYLTGLDIWQLVICASIGNSLGGMFNYGVGLLGSDTWIYRLFHLRQDRLERAKKQIRRHGAWMGLLAWLPFLGSVITIALGLLRVSLWRSALTVTLGKVARYILLAFLLQSL